jgi:hypothetical protein
MKKSDLASIRVFIEKAVEANELAICSAGVQPFGRDVVVHSGYSFDKLRTGIDVSRISIKLYMEICRKDRERATNLMRWLYGKPIYKFSTHQEKKLVEDIDAFKSKLREGGYDEQ